MVLFESVPFVSRQKHGSRVMSWFFSRRRCRACVSFRRRSSFRSSACPLNLLGENTWRHDLARGGVPQITLYMQNHYTIF